jgi:hypothetical protein
MRIPTSFQLGGTTWKVEQTTPLLGAMGATFSGQALVQLDKALPKQVKEQTFCHEAVHCILFSMGKPSSEHDEVFVDGFATFLHQFLTSQR